MINRQNNLLSEGLTFRCNQQHHQSDGRWLQRNVSPSLNKLFCLFIMALFRVLCWALIFILHVRFPPGYSIATIALNLNIVLLKWICNKVANLYQHSVLFLTYILGFFKTSLLFGFCFVLSFLKLSAGSGLLNYQKYTKDDRVDGIQPISNLSWMLVTF